MAIYYWVGGAGTWNNTTTTNWSLSSGGAGGAGVPTSADDAIFNSASSGASYLVTIGVGAVCNNLTMTAPATGTLTLGGTSSATLNIYGSLSSSTNVVRSSSSNWTGSITFAATTVGNTINFGSLSASGSPFNGIFFNGSGSWTLTGNFNSGQARINLSAGTLNTSTFNLTSQAFISTSGSTRAVDFGSGTHTFSEYTGTGAAFSVSAPGTGLTLTANTSTISLGNSTGIRAGLSTYSYNNITITGANNQISFLGTISFGTCNTLTFPTTAGNNSFITVNGTVNGSITGGRTTIYERTLLVNSTLVLNGTSTLKNTDFINCTVTGTGAPLTGTSLGDAGGNSGITFPAAKTSYLVGTSAVWLNISNRYSNTSGGAGSDAYWALPQDTIVIDNNSPAVLDQVANLNYTYFLGNLNASTRTTTFTISTTTATSSMLCVRDVNFSASVAFSYPTSQFTSLILFYGPIASTFTALGSLPIAISINDSKTVNLGSNISSSPTGTTNWKLITNASSVLNTNNYNITYPYINHTGGTINAGTSTLTANGVGTATVLTASGSITATGTPTVNITNAASTGTRTVTANSSVDINVTTGTDTISMGTTVRSLNLTGYSGTIANNNITIYGDLTIPTTTTLTAGTLATTFASTSGTKTITTNGKTLDFPVNFSGSGGTWQLQDNLTIGSSRTLSIIAGTLDTNTFSISTGLLSTSTSGIFLLGANPVTITGNTATVLSIANGTITATGTPTFNLTYSGATGTRTINGRSATSIINVTAGTDIVSISAQINELNFTGFSGTFTTGASTSIYGNLTLSSTMTTAVSANALSFAITGGTTTLTTNGVVFNFPITFSGVGGTFQLQDDVTTSSTVTTSLTGGTLNLNNKNLTTGLFASSNSNTRTLAFGTIGAIYLSGTSTIWNISTSTGFTSTGSKNVYATASSATSRTITPGGLSESLAFNFYITAGTGIVTLVGSGTSTYNNLDFTGFSGTAAITTVSAVVYGNLTLSSTMSITTVGGSIQLDGSTSTAFTTNNISIPANVIFNKISPASATLIGDLNMSSGTIASLTRGTLTATTSNVTAGSFNSNNTSVRALNMGSGTWTTLDAAGWNMATSTNMTLNAGTSTINMTASVAQQFNGGGKIYYNLNQGGSGALTIAYNNTFNNLTNTVQPTTVTFFIGYSQTFTGDFLLSGTVGNLVTVNTSTAGTRVTLRKPSTWYMGANSTNVSNNLNLIFTAGGGIDYLSVQDIQGNIANVVSITESATYTDSQNGIIKIVLDMVESMSMSESMAVGSVLAGTIQDTVTFTDSRTGNYLFTLTVNEASTLTATQTGGFQVNASVEDTITSTDTNTGRGGFSGAYSDTITYSDSLSALANYLGVSIDTITITATQTGNRDTNTSLAETATFTDTNTGNAGFVSSTAEIVTLTDALTSIANFVGTAAETATFTESMTGGIFFLATCADTVTFSEALGNLSTYNVTVQDTATFTDSTAGGIFFALNVNDAVTITDTTASSVVFMGAVNEGVDIYALQDVTILFTANIHELLGTDDTYVGSAALIGVLAEIITLTTFAYYEGWFRINDSQTSNWVEINNYQG